MNATTQSESTALAISSPPGGRELILQVDNLNAMMRVSEMMANSGQAVPRHLRKNAGACLAVTMQAMRWNMDPFALGLKTYTTDDNAPLAYEGQAIIAALNNSPLLASRLTFRWDGDWNRIVGRFKQIESKSKKDAHGEPKKYIVPDWDFNKDEEGLSVTVSARLAGEREPRELTLLMKQARVRNSPLWTEDPKQQLAYLAGRRWGRLHAPDVIMGVYTREELESGEEKFMGMAEEVSPPPPPPPPSYDQAKFDVNFPKWAETIKVGRKTAADYIQFVAARGEPYTEEQKAKLLAVKVDRNASATDVEPKATTAATAPAQPVATAAVVTFAEVADRIAKAQSQDDLKDMDELIGAVADAGQREELTAKLNKRADELPAF